MKQKSKTVGAVGIALMVFLIALAIVVDVLCAAFSDAIGLFFRDRDVDAGDEIQAANEYTVEQEAGGMVLMKNENAVLPLSSSTTRVNLFGALSVKQLYLGTGSAGGWNWDPEKFVDLKTALSEVGITVNEDLWDFYSNLTGDAGANAGSVTDMQGSTHSIVDVDLDYEGYEEVRESAESYSDTAFVVVGRAGGEGSDAVMDMTPYESTGGWGGGSTQQNQGGSAGYHYLELMPQERELVEYVKATFKNVVLLVNTPMPIEMDFVDGDQRDDGTGNIDSVLWIGMPGSTGNRAVAQALTGEFSPSGRTADTWAYEVESAPSYYNFGDYTYDAAAAGADRLKYLHYQEGIYVGYRWYETANAEGVRIESVGNYHDYKGIADGKGGSTVKSFDFSDYDSIVQYPFGYGLSYTTFSMEFEGTPAYDSSTNEFTFNVKVTNTGDTYASRTPVELYVETPYDPAEGIEKSKVVLRTFTKTDEIAPGESETVTLTVNRDDLASYDSVETRGYKLSDGDYTFYLDYGKYGSHCWANTDDGDSVLSWTYSLAEDILFTGSNNRDSDLTTATNQFDDVAKGDGAYTPIEDDLSRADFAATFPKSYAAGTQMNKVNENTARRLNDNVHGATLQGYNPDTFKYEGEFADENGEYKDPDSGYEPLPVGQSGSLVCADLVGVDYDDPLWDQLISQMSQGDLENLISSCGWQNPAIPSIGKNAAIDMDGAEGLHDLVSDVEANCYTCAPITASSFDVELAYGMGTTYADECLANGVSGMYGFSTNTHRSPFGGRCFEYYSEDGTLAGMICAAQTSGLQDKGVAVYTKHFAFNEQEKNRSGVHTWLSEQAAREIYLRPYEIITHRATNGDSILTGVTGFMTAYNSIGTSHTAAHYPMLHNVLREEWGFNGRIVTDAGGTDSISCSVRAGLDMNLGFSATGRLDTFDGIDNTSGYGLMKVQEAAKHQLYIFVNSSGLNAAVSINSAWVWIPVAITVVLVAGAALIFVFMVRPAFFGRKQK